MTDQDHDVVRVLRRAADQHRYRDTVDVADVMRSAANRRRENARHRTVVAGATAAAGVVAAVITTVSLAVGPGRGPAIGPSGPEDPVAALSLLSRPAVAGDEIPAVNDSVAEEGEPYGMVSGTTRLVVEADGVGYYAAISPEGDACVLVHLQAENQVASACTPLERFDDVGVWVTASDSSGIEITGLLLPDRLADPTPGSLEGLLERAGTGASGESTLLASNLLAVIDPTAPTTRSPTGATPPTNGAVERVTIGGRLGSGSGRQVSTLADRTPSPSLRSCACRS